MKQLVLLVSFLAVPAPVARAVPSRPADASGGTTTRPVRAFDLDLAAQLAASPEVTSRQEAVGQDLSGRIAGYDDPLDRAQAHLACANWLLATPTARPATCWLIGVERADHLERIAEAAEAAREHLARARKLLQSDETATDERERRRSDLARTADALEAFAALFAAARSGAEPAERRSAFAAAALRLAVVREAEDAEVAACALLWQSLGWALGGRSERALGTLPEALVPPRQLSYDFLSRLLRCRIMADAGQHAAATALAIRMRAECEQWFRQALPSELDARRLLVVLLQCQVGRSWLEQLGASDQPAAAEGLQRMLTRLQEALFPEGRPQNVYVLERAVPIVVEPPSLHSQSPSSAPATSTAPASAPRAIHGGRPPLSSSQPASGP